jgi:hypothetical protein
MKNWQLAKGNEQLNMISFTLKLIIQIALQE